MDKVWDKDLQRSTLLEEVVALSSYFPLSGSAFSTEGDGLIPGMLRGKGLCRRCEGFVVAMRMQRVLVDGMVLLVQILF